MSETWAEGSGSTWGSPDGDTSIVPGAEVLLGLCADDGLYTPSMRRFVGRRARVMSVRQEHKATCKTDCDAVGWNWRVRDLVCLRTADGKLTEEGKALGALENPGVANYKIPQWMYDWLERAGIVDRNTTGGGWVRVPYRIIGTRLAMALGREETKADAAMRGCADCDQYPGCPIQGGGRCAQFARHPAPPEHKPAPVMCERCGVQPARERSSRCADCDQIHEDVWRETSMAPVEQPAPPDLSGERHMDALRSWLRRPMGTR